ncbi:hypothetical protein IWW51_001224 [Coemansia sp. RSA 2702]|nr:hypothetical protein IWW54_004266 [Coemansia sp. RSA 2705]KAJ2328401.1 hypothetical protein IWW51_001224 [Coemansia sp. RSA 2702]
MTREEKPRGLRARLRQRRARNSSEDEVRSRPTSLDLGRRTEPALLRAGMQSLTAVPTRADAYADGRANTYTDGRANAYMDGSANTYMDGLGAYANDSPGGLALGEFSAEGGEVAEDEEYAAAQPSGAIVRSPDEAASDGPAASPESQQQQQRQARRARRESAQSMPAYDPASPRAAFSYAGHSDYLRSDLSGGSSAYSSDADFDADSELNAVYLKRNADFHLLFRNIPINELLIDDYGCALQRDILVQGRLYLTENFVCFYSNIFGWVTNLVIALDEIVSIEKRMTALIIPNAIQISTLHAKHFFGSFIYRDSAYNQLYDMWAKSRSEKHAGVPETGQAEDGAGAGDVSRHRQDILDNAYQSLSEDESRSQRSRDGQITSGDEEGSVSSSDDAGGASGRTSGGSESDVSSAPSLAVREKTREPAGAANGADRAVPVAAAANGGDVSPPSATDASSIFPQTAPDSTVNSTANVSRAGSQLLAKPGAEPNGVSATTAAVAASTAAAAAVTAAKAAAAPSKKLLARLPKTPEATDAGASQESLVLAAPAQHPGVSVLHAPTTCPCGSNGRTAHYSQEALDASFPLALPLLFRVVFSAAVPASVEKQYMAGVSGGELAASFTRRIGECGNSDVRTEGWVPDPSDAAREMCIYTYEKPLGFSIGPKSTTVEDTFRIALRDFERAVVVEQVVKTPNVPSGTTFFVKIRHCLSWTSGPGRQPPGGWTHYRMTFEVEWTKTSWFKNAIEKGSADSNKQAGEQLEKYIREWIAAHPDMEVKAENHVAASAAAAAAAAATTAVHRRHRKAGRKHKREASPRGLRMEEILGSASDNRKRATRAAADAGGLPANGAPAAAALAPTTTPSAAAAAAATARAPAGAAGWRQALRMSQSAAAAVLALALLLAVSNLWRLTAPGSRRAPADQMARVQASLDAMAAQMVEMNRQLQQLMLDRPSQPQ